MSRFETCWRLPHRIHGGKAFGVEQHWTRLIKRINQCREVYSILALSSVLKETVGSERNCFEDLKWLLLRFACNAQTIFGPVPVMHVVVSEARLEGLQIP